jgi:tRNA A37 threonylcarbamoyladenosine dehydratase
MDGQIGRLKTSAMAERARAINPECEVVETEAFFRDETADSILARGFDLVVDAIDTVFQKSLLLARCHQRGIPVVTCGAGGGRRDPTRIRTDDLARTSHDPLMLAVRRNLRSHHGFPKAPDGKRPPLFGIPAVFSDEAPVFPGCDGTTTTEKPADASLRLNCDSGYGTATPVTASFGLTAAAVALDLLG